MQRFVDAWRGEFEYHQAIDENLIREKGTLMVSTPPTWASGADPGYITPGPLPMTVRAMSYVVVYAATQLEESSQDRAASCFAKGQLRCDHRHRDVALLVKPDSRGRHGLGHGSWPCPSCV